MHNKTNNVGAALVAACQNVSSEAAEDDNEMNDVGAALVAAPKTPEQSPTTQKDKPWIYAVSTNR